MLTNPPPGKIAALLLLTDGSVIANETGTKRWFRLSPDASGGYVRGTWSFIADMQDTHVNFGATVLRSGHAFVAGGEMGTGGNTIEIYDPIHDQWLFVSGAGLADIGDAPASVIADGRVLLLPRGATSGSLFIPDPFNPSAGFWSTTTSKLRSDPNDNESVVQLRDGSLLAVGAGAQKYVPSMSQWVDAGLLPVQLMDATNAIGAGLLLYDGRALFLGATGATALYTPPANPLDPGTWQQGASIPPGRVADEAPAVVMPNGHVLLIGDAGQSRPPAALFDYDPAADAMTGVVAPWSLESSAASPHRMLLLPTGQVMLSDSTAAGRLAVYTPVGAPDAAFKPTIDTVYDLHRGNGSFFMTGANLNGFTEGAYYGDENQASTNYPLLRLTDVDGIVRYARTYDVNSRGVAPGPGGVYFSIPGVAPGSYAASVVVNGIASDPSTLVITEADAQCTDQVMGGAETDIDCGGPTCARCGGGLRCSLGSDCVSNICTRGICQPAAVPVQIVRNDASAAVTNAVSVGCPEGTRMIGGGCAGGDAGLELQSSYPLDERAWHCDFAGGVGASGFAACLDDRLIAGEQVIHNRITAATSEAIEASCPAGTSVVGGGCIDVYLATFLRGSYPDPASESWQCRFTAFARNGSPLTLEAVAVCIDAAVAASMGIEIATLTAPTAAVSCPAGKRVITGGCSDQPGVVLQSLAPDTQNHAWTCQSDSATSSSSALSAVCVNE
jgi:hypothetical protein